MTQLIRQFKDFYSDFVAMDLDRVSEIYSDQVIFRDPVLELRGTAELRTYLADAGSNVDFCRFEFLDQLIAEQSAYLKWNMHFQHPRLGSETITVRGISQLQFEQKIHYHEDSYDMGAMLYEHLPVLGSATRWLRRRMASSVSTRGR